MRKYLVAVAVGAMLVASQAAADDNAIAGVGGRLSDNAALSSDYQGSNALLILLFTTLFVGLAVWGFSTGNNGGTPHSP